DGGKTWSDGGPLISYHGLGPASCQTLDYTAVQIQNGEHVGRIVIPYYLEMDGQHPDYTRQQRGGYAVWKGEKIPLETHTHVPELAGGFMNLSDDEGATWGHSDGFLMGYLDDGHLGHWSCEEPVVAELKDGRLLCFIRSTCGRILKSTSGDGGQSWSKVEATELAMSNSPCRLNRIPGTGDLVLLWNQMSADEIQRGYRRGRLSIAISKDDGKTWEGFRTVVQSPGVDDVTRVEPPPLTPMVRGGSGPDEILGEIPDGFVHYHYPEIHFSRDGETIHLYVRVSTPGGGLDPIWRSFPIRWLYEGTD
ncbi:MAG: sialidase family protein, partial [Candidatus Latescibacteria bacterium]|nr:sialidase family protein [Candidatus Latescibacterota bacterium]